MVWVLTRATRRNIPEDGTLHSHRRENLKSYESFQVCPSSSVDATGCCAVETSSENQISLNSTLPNATIHNLSQQCRGMQVDATLYSQVSAQLEAELGAILAVLNRVIQC
jgi:hypothetical protein